MMQDITHTTVDLMKRGAMEDGALKPDKVPEQIIFKLTWVQFNLYVL